MLTETLDRSSIRQRLDSMSAAWRRRIDAWKQSGQTHTEKSFAQQYWSDLLRTFDVIPERIDLFERDATRASTGGVGYIDFFWSGVALGEAKSLGRDLDSAFDQAMDYLRGGSIEQHEWPRHILVTDFETLRVDRLGDEPWTIRLAIDDLGDHVDQLAFLAGAETITKAEEEEASIQAAKLMASLFTSMAGDDIDVGVSEEAPVDQAEEDEATQKASILMTRLLFLLYGDDAGLWEQDLFYRWVEHDTTAENLGPQLAALFDVLNTPLHKRRRTPQTMAKFPYVNGGIFDGESSQIFLTPEMREALLAACRFRWNHISPAIFGSMFQLVKSKQARRGDGEHYTSEENILKTIGPLFLDEYRQRADKLIAAKSTTLKALTRFQDEIASNIYVDPACGAGNFLNVAYAKLRDIETDIIVAKFKRGDQTGSLDATLDQRLTIDRFYGFELNWWPAKIAETAMFLVDHQANRKLAQAIGEAPDRLPIEITAHIVHDDALKLDWAETLPKPAGKTFVFGNPPWLGDHTRSDEQLALMQQAWGEKKQLSRLDFVTSWHALTLRLFQRREGEWAFVTTNGICQGDQPSRLFTPIFDAGWKIKFAHRTFKWNSEAPGQEQAQTHCVIVGFTRDEEVNQRLFNYESVIGEPTEVQGVKQINAYLTNGPNVLVTKRTRPLSPDMPKVVKGSMPTDGGNLVIKPEDYQRVMSDPVMSPYVRPYIGGDELISRKQRWCLWLQDMDPEAPSKSAELRERLRGVEAARLGPDTPQTTKDYARFPHLFRQIGIVSDKPIVGIPEVSSESRHYLPVGHLEPGTIISNKVYGAEDPDGMIFAVASSSAFITWMKTVGGRRKSDPSFSSTYSWNGFPLPHLKPVERRSIANAGKKVLEARKQLPERSLAEHYAPLSMAKELVKAHDALDSFVDKALGAPRRCRDQRERQRYLFESYSRLEATSQR